MKFPINKRVYISTNGVKDFYIMKCGNRDWYVEAYPHGTMDYTRKTIGGFTTKKVALECVEAWSGWMTK